MKRTDRRYANGRRSRQGIVPAFRDGKFDGRVCYHLNGPRRNCAACCAAAGRLWPRPKASRQRRRRNAKAGKARRSVVIKDGIATFDFSGSGPQARRAINLRPSMIEACVFYSLIGCLDPKLQFNDGMRDVVRISRAAHVTMPSRRGRVSNYQMVNPSWSTSFWRRWRSSIRHGPLPMRLGRAP